MQPTPLQPTPHGRDSGGPDPDELLTHVDWLRRLARALVRDDAAADDLVQDAMEVAVRADAPIRDLRAFLAGTLRRLALRSRRGDTRRARREREVAKPVDAELPPADVLAEQVDTLRVVLEELRELPAAQQRAVSLRYLEDLDAGEIARREGSSPSTVRAHLTRGLAALRERLDRRAGGRDAWCAVLAPFAGLGAPLAPTPSGDVPGGELPLPDPNVALTATEGLIGAAGAAGVLAMTIKTLTLTLALVPVVLVGAWTLGGDRGGAVDRTVARPSQDAGRGGADLALVPERRDVPRETLAAPTDPAVESAPAAEAAAGAGAARLEGRVVDARTGDPVPSIELIVVPVEPDESGARRSVSVTTDGAGAFVDDLQELPVGDVEVTFIDDHGGILSQPQKDTLPFPFEEPLEAKVGPTFEIDWSENASFDPRGFMVEYVLAGSAYANRPIDARMRAGGGTWVRFGARALEIEGDGPWTLQLRGGDGLLRGQATVHRTAGVEPLPVRFEMESVGAVEFVLHAEVEGQIAAARVDVRPIGAPEKDAERVFLGRHDRNGDMRGRVEFAAPGRYAWRFGAEGTGLEGEVDVVAGELTTVELSSLDLGSTFDTHVLVDMSEAPEHHGDWRCFVVQEKDPSTGFMTAPRRNEADPEGFLRIDLDSLLDGRWVVGMQAGEGYSVRPSSVHVGPGDPIPTVKVVPGAPRVDVRIVPLDAEGTRIDGAEAFFMVDLTDAGQFERSEAPVLGPQSLPAQGETSVVVRAPGYRAKEVLVDPARDGVEIEVRLDGGWSNRVIVIDPSTMTFLADVDVHVDGELAGRTDHRGVFWVEGDAPPDLVEVALETESVEVHDSPFERSGGRQGRDPLMGWVFAASRR